MKHFPAWTTIAFLSLPGLAAAAPFDGSAPLLCATMQTHLCSADAECESQTASDNDIPRFLKVSVQNKKVTGTRPSGATIDASIDAVRHAKGTMYLQGGQEAFAWNMAIGEQDGSMTLTAVNAENGMVIFGACAKPD
jgi:hypothetical protein